MKTNQRQIISKILDICTAVQIKRRLCTRITLTSEAVNPYLEMLTKNGIDKCPRRTQSF